MVFGQDYAWLGLQKAATGLRLSLRVCRDARNGAVEQEQAGRDVPGGPLFVRVSVAAGGRCHFSYSFDGRRYQELGETFSARPGLWVGAKLGLFARAAQGGGRAGHLDVDCFG